MITNSTLVVEMFTDGACRGNPGPGGWGVLLRYQGKTRTLYGAVPDTTNNRMELLATINGLAALKRPCRVEVTTDSQYVRKGITEWLVKWKTNNWRNSNNKPVKNRDLWEQLEQLTRLHQITWHWVRGHSGHPENELVDALANHAIDELGSSG